MSNKRKHQKSIINNCLLSDSLCRDLKRWATPCLCFTAEWALSMLGDAHPTYSQRHLHRLCELPRQHPKYFTVLHRETSPLFFIWILPAEFQACSFLFLLLERFKQDYHNIFNNCLYRWKLLSWLLPTSLQKKGLPCVSWCFLGALALLLFWTVPALFIQESCWTTLQLSLPKIYKKKRTSGYNFEFLHLTVPWCWLLIFIFLFIMIPDTSLKKCYLIALSSSFVHPNLNNRFHMYSFSISTCT